MPNDRLQTREAMLAGLKRDRTMRERIARCVELAIVRHGIPEADLEGTLDDADAILDELREPTETMIEAAPDGWRDPARGWRLMIEAAKQERG